MLNLVLIAFFVGLACFFYWKEEKEQCLLLLSVLYGVCPVIALGGGRGINSAYMVTALTGGLMIVEFLRRRALRVRWLQWGYLLSSQLIIAAMMLGAVVNGKGVMANLSHFIGMEQAAAGIFCLSVLYSSWTTNLRTLMGRNISVTIGVHFAFSVLQRLSLTLGGGITKQLFTYSGSNGPIDSVLETGDHFVRLQGAAYSPTVLGILSLALTGFCCVQVLRGKDRKYYILLFGAEILGQLAFSKLTISGTVILVALSIVLMLLAEGKRLLVRRTIRGCVGVTAAAYAAVMLFNTSIGLGPYVHYYYIEAINPFTAMQTRYAGVDEALKPLPTPGPGSEPQEPGSEPGAEPVQPAIPEGAGNTFQAMALFRAHPVIGVGPGAVENEFVGDSEFVNLLHGGGLVAFLLCGLYYLSVFLVAIRHKNWECCMLILAAGMGCFSLPIFTLRQMIPFLAFCVCAAMPQPMEE